jgi:hypothetical protein
LVRSAKQFFIHARFDPAQRTCSEGDYVSKIREIKRRHVHKPSAERDRIVFPGFEGLRDFSAAHEKILKENLGGAWQSYVNRRHWRMLVPFTRSGVATEAKHLVKQLSKGRTPVVHVYRFPQLTINHALLLFGVEETSDGLTFKAYDPNLPDAPSKLLYFKGENRFELPRNIYWAGGLVNVYETYTGSKFSRSS